jgi:hypothetical protein
MSLSTFASLPYTYQPNATQPSEITLYKNCSNLFSAMIVLIPTLGDFIGSKVRDGEGGRHCPHVRHGEWSRRDASDIDGIKPKGRMELWEK